MPELPRPAFVHLLRRRQRRQVAALGQQNESPLRTHRHPLPRRGRLQRMEGKGQGVDLLQGDRLRHPRAQRHRRRTRRQDRHRRLARQPAAGQGHGNIV